MIPHPEQLERESSETCADLLRFIDDSPTPYHVSKQVADRLTQAGFVACRFEDDFCALPAGHGFFIAEDAAVFAFVKPKTRVHAFRIVGAHTDSPNLRLKPRPLYEKAGYVQVGVEVYGGALLHTWLDRDLRLCGRAIVRDGYGCLQSKLVSLREPIVRIPQLAIHLDREVSEKGLQLNRQEHLAPIVGLQEPGKTGVDEKLLKTLCAKELACSATDIVQLDLHVADAVPSTVAGLSREFVFAPRLDNLAMCHAGLSALLRARSQGSESGVVQVLALFDHEEVGSVSDRGADSALLSQLLERISGSSGCTAEHHQQALARSLCVSADMAHGVHPNYADRHEPHHKPLLNRGPVIKYNAQQRYATSAKTAAHMMELARRAQIPLQEYVHRTDLPCGSTIGPRLSAHVGIPTVDVGNPMLSMHSAREMAGAHDPEQMSRLLALFFLS